MNDAIVVGAITVVVLAAVGTSATIRMRSCAVICLAISLAACAQTTELSRDSDAGNGARAEMLAVIDKYYAPCEDGSDQRVHEACLKLGGFGAWFGALKRAGAAESRGGWCVDDNGWEVCAPGAPGEPREIEPSSKSRTGLRSVR